MLTVAKKSVVKKVAAPTYSFEVEYPWKGLDADDIEDMCYDLRNDLTERKGIFIRLYKQNIKKIEQCNRTLQISATNVSCGVFQLFNISTLEYVINHYSDFKNRKSELKKVLVEVIAEIKEKMKCAFLIASNNDRTPEINKILDSICTTKTDYLPNPNMDSSSSICCWIL